MADRWKRYFEELLDDEFANEIGVIPHVEGPIEDITKFEVGKATEGMKNLEAIGLSGVAAEMSRRRGSGSSEDNCCSRSYSQG